MTVFSPMFLGLGEASRFRTLIAPGYYSAPGAFARVGSKWDVSPAGIWSEYGSNVPAFGGPGNWMSIEGQATNYIRNPRGEASGNSLPTNWIQFTNAGLIYAYSFGTIDGIRYTDVRISGTASGTVADIGFEGVGGIAGGGVGTVWTESVHTAVVAGSMANISSANLRMVGRDGSNEYESWTAPINTGATLTRVSVTGTIANAGSTSLLPGIRLGLSAGAVDVTLRLWMPNAKRLAIVDSPVLPPSGAPAQATRNADQPIMSLSQAGVSAGQGTAVLSFMVPQAAPTGVAQGLLMLTNGTNNYHLSVRNVAASTDVAGVIVNNGVAGGYAGPVATPIIPGVATAVGITWDATGYSIAMRGGSPVTATAAVPGNLTTLHVGANQIGGVDPLSGRAGWLLTRPPRVSPAYLQSLVNGMPLT